jgi:hypothetical protein
MKIQTKVLFRKWKKDGTVIALFPEEIADSSGYYCNSYEHVGQHGGCEPDLVIKKTTPATKKEYQELYQELTAIGYNLKVMKYVPANAFYVRCKKISELGWHFSGVKG